MCRLLEVSRCGFYAWQKREPSRRSRADVALRQKIIEVHALHREVLGALKTWQFLNATDIPCGKHRVARLRKLEGIESKRKVRFRVMRQYNKIEPPAPDLVKRQFNPVAPNQIWVSDITTVRTREGWLHLAIVLDLFARKVVGWAMDSTQRTALPIAALQMAIHARKPAAGTICHSDQGSVYGAASYREVLALHGLQPSMSRKGNCHDNAVAESFFSTVKNETTHHSVYDTRQDAKAAIGEYIEMYYNRARPHQTLGYRTPAQAEAQFQVLN